MVVTTGRPDRPTLRPARMVRSGAGRAVPNAEAVSGPGSTFPGFRCMKSGLAASARCWRLECLRAPQGCSHSRRCPDPADRAGQRVRSTSSRRRSIFPGPKRSLTCARILSGRASAFFCGVRPRGAAASRRLHGVELPIALFDAASPFVPGNRGADMVRASALA